MRYCSAQQNRSLSAISGPVSCLLLIPSAHNYLWLFSYHGTQTDCVQKPQCEQEAACLECPNKVRDNAALGKSMSMIGQAKAIMFSPRQAYCWLVKAVAVPRGSDLPAQPSAVPMVGEALGRASFHCLSAILMSPGSKVSCEEQLPCLVLRVSAGTTTHYLGPF